MKGSPCFSCCHALRRNSVKKNVNHNQMSRTVKNYRCFCNTESAYVYTWSTTAPTTCPNNNTHTIDPNSIVVVDSVSSTETAVSNLPKTPFNEVRVAERTRVIELKSVFGISSLRDIVTTTGTGSVTNTLGDPEFTMTVSGANDTAQLQSADRGRYVAGLQGEVGMACRLPASLTGNQVIKIGIFDNSNGLYFKYTAAGMFACVLRDGVEIATPQSQWNIDKFDGTGPSGVNGIDYSKGIIFIIDFTWYGYGGIIWSINTSINTTQTSWYAHHYSPQGQTSIKNPNLPLTVTMANNGTVANRSIYVAGRQFSLLGKYNPIYRLNSVYATAATVNSTTFVPIISIRRKTGYLGNPIKLDQCDFIASANMIIQVRVLSTSPDGTTITGGGSLSTTAATNTSANLLPWANIPDTSPNDTAAQCYIVPQPNPTASISGGIPIWCGMVSGTNNASGTGSLDAPYMLPEYYIMTICARLISGNNGNLSVAMRWTEEW